MPKLYKIEPNWLDWCRLCASNDASISVQHNNVYMSIISKCFDIEIGHEEPELGAMLCKDCYCFIGRLLTFVHKVNKVQPIFELLRHTELSDQVDEIELRNQYGLQNQSGESGYTMETSELVQEIEQVDNQIFHEDGIDNPDNTATNKKPGRPKKIIKELLKESYEPNEEHKLFKDVAFEIKADHTITFKEDSVQENLTQNLIAFADASWTETANPQQRQRDSPVKTDALNAEQELDLRISSVEAGDILDGFIPLQKKRKRGRPRKEYKNCKNVALSRLLNASPKSEPETRLPHKSKNNLNNKSKLQPATCGICHKKLASRFSLKIHMDRVHTNKKPFVCDCCGKSVKSSSELREHKLVHTDEKPFVCSLCHAAFKNQKRLNIHSQTHGEPSYECEICGKKLQTRAIWNKHKYVHTNERRFKCTICGTTTKNSTALKTHLLSHTGLRPYTCKYCNKDFACGVNCREHKKKVHPVEYAQDDDKSSRISNVPTLNELRVIAAGMEKSAPLRNPRYFKSY